MKKYILVVLNLILLLSCNNDDSSDANQENITEYKPHYMNYRNLNYGLSTYDLYDGDNVKLEYSNGKISKRITNLLMMGKDKVPIPVHFKRTDDIIYQNNQINIISKSENEDMFPKFEKQISLNGDKILQILNIGSYTTDTLKFSYSKNILSFITVYNKGVKSKSTFYFNKNKNIDSIVTKSGTMNYVSSTDYSYSFDGSTKRRKKIILSNYDHVKNPLKKLILFDETFIRSLSENNYKSYGEYFYNDDNTKSSYLEYTWNLIYENNKINFAK